MAEPIASLGVVFLSSVIFILIALRLHLPPLVGLLLAGALIGPNAFGLVSFSDNITLFADVGSILLLFFVGVELRLDVIARVWLRALFVWFLKDGLVFILTYELALFAGISELPALILASGLCISSTTFFLRLKTEEGAEGNEINTLFVVLIIEDILAVFLIALYGGMEVGGISVQGTAISLARAVISLVVAYAFFRHFITWIFERLEEVSSEEVWIYSSLSVAILFAAIAGTIGLTPGVGAFLAGTMVSATKGYRKAEHTLSQFGMLFSSFFFISIGMHLNLGVVLQYLPLIVLFSFTIMIVSFFSIFVGTFLVGSTSSRAVLSALFMLPVGEFSLMIARYADPLVPLPLLDISAGVVFITALCSGVLVKLNKTIDTLITSMIHPSIRSAAKRLSRYTRSVLREFEVEGSIHQTAILEGRTILRSLSIIAVIIVLSILLEVMVWFTVPHVWWIVLLMSLFLIFLPLITIARSLQRLIDTIARAFNQHILTTYAPCDAIPRTAAMALGWFAFAFIIPPGIAVLRLPAQFSSLFLIPLSIGFLYLWNIIKLSMRPDSDACEQP